MLFYWDGSLFFVFIILIYLYQYIKSNKNRKINLSNSTKFTTSYEISGRSCDSECSKGAAERGTIGLGVATPNPTSLSGAITTTKITPINSSKINTIANTINNNIYLLPEYQKCRQIYLESKIDYIFNAMFSILDELNDEELLREFADTTQTDCHQLNINKIENLVDAIYRKIRQSYDSFDDFITDFDEKILYQRLCSQLFIPINTLHLFLKYIKFIQKEELIEKNETLACLIVLMKKLS